MSILCGEIFLAQEGEFLLEVFAHATGGGEGGAEGASAPPTFLEGGALPPHFHTFATSLQSTRCHGFHTSIDGVPAEQRH